MRMVRNNQSDQIQKEVFYEDYLKSVLTSSDEFSEINELIDRYATLHITNKDLVRIDNECQEDMQTLATDATRNKENHRIQMLGYALAMYTCDLLSLSLSKSTLCSTHGEHLS